MDIGNLEARITELETRFRKLGLLEPAPERADEGGTGGCTHGCTRDCPDPSGDCTYDCTYGCTNGCSDASCVQAEETAGPAPKGPTKKRAARKET